MMQYIITKDIVKQPIAFGEVSYYDDFGPRSFASDMKDMVASNLKIDQSKWEDWKQNYKFYYCLNDEDIKHISKIIDYLFHDEEKDYAETKATICTLRENEDYDSSHDAEILDNHIFNSVRYLAELLGKQDHVTHSMGYSIDIKNLG